MSKIDVTELLTDPDFVDTLVLVNRTPTVNTKGENVLSENEILTVGCVQPMDGKTLLRLPENLRVENLSTFWVKGHHKIVTLATGKYSSLVVFRGMRYAVRHVFDWSMAGAGWCEGACIAEVAAP